MIDNSSSLNDSTGNMFKKNDSRGENVDYIKTESNRNYNLSLVEMLFLI